ncbi:MAG: hypothetical protein M0Z59_09755 [Nitrospiraceae bacterium]|nr:hypothetical protein [Nitrospiraceae bacterium]
METRKKSIGRLLVEYGLISEADLEEGLTSQKETGLRLGETLVRLGKIKMEDIEWILSKQLDIPFVIIDDAGIDPELIKKFPRDFLLENRILPVLETDGEVAIVTDDPFNSPAFEHIKSRLRKEVKLSAGSGRQIEDILSRFFSGDRGAPQLVSWLESLLPGLEGTSFYRLDFILREDRFDVNLYGLGVLKELFASVEGALKKEDVFKAFDALEVPFLYEERLNGREKTFLAVYPLSGGGPMEPNFPLVAGSYGLYRPGGVVFTDASAWGAQDVFHSGGPVPGYPYIAVKRQCAGCGRVVYTPDTVPPGFANYYVSASVPSVCAACGGAGCGGCGMLGYEFERMEGFYSSADLDKIKNKNK